MRCLSSHRGGACWGTFHRHLHLYEVIILTNYLVVIAVSSPHRKEAFAACEQILEEIKSRAQIWKRECYEGEDENQAEWKSNK
jgi:molybdopterin synthase catalytic subunit